MFNKNLKEEAIEKVKEAAKKYEKKYNQVNQQSIVLFELREKCKEEVIEKVEAFINAMANTPKEFEKSFNELKIEYREFKNEVFKLEEEARKVDFESGGVAGAGVAAGIGTAALLPTGAMAVATTFGVASTGTAIASLSGAAATNAALAWLGGGALVAGGGGMAAGSAFLALAGPIGWGIAGAGIVSGGLMASSKNKKIAEEADSQRYDIERGKKKLKKALKEMEGIIEVTKKYSVGIKEMLQSLSSEAPKDYSSYTKLQKEKLASLINHIESLSKLINKKVKVDE